MMSRNKYNDFQQQQRLPLQPASAQWYVIHSLPQKERTVAAALQQHNDVATFLPEVRSYKRGNIAYSSFFPCYLFAQIDLHITPPSFINTTPGVVKLVTIAGQPQPLPESIITALQQHIEQLDAAGGLAAPDLQPGDAVEIQQGPLRGLMATFVGPTTPSVRVRVLLEMLGRLNEVEIERAALQPASAPTSSKPPRRTRGRGRTINAQSR